MLGLINVNIGLSVVLDIHGCIAFGLVYNFPVFVITIDIVRIGSAIAVSFDMAG